MWHSFLSVSDTIIKPGAKFELVSQSDVVQPTNRERSLLSLSVAVLSACACRPSEV